MADPAGGHRVYAEAWPATRRVHVGGYTCRPCLASVAMHLLTLLAANGPTAADWLAAWGQVVGAAATFAAVVVALWLARQERGHVRVKLKVGAMNEFGSGATAPPAAVKPGWFEGLAEQGYRRPVVAVEVANVGRQPVTVKGWNLTSPRGVSLSPIGDSIGPALPHRLDVGEAVTFAVDMEHVRRFIEACKTLPKPSTLPSSPSEAFRKGWRGDRDGLSAVVDLADGRSRRSADIIPIG
jgi:hypothetical protein